jgi:glycosyltransferase involved in cell wall biosynthesis
LFENIEVNKPLISVITVVYNDEKNIENTIKSVINQSYLNIEYIIIDGGSTDNTTNIIRKYEEYIDYWISEKDDGIYNAMNKGAFHAHGVWVNYMNSGDEFYNTEVIEKIFSKGLESGVIYGDTLYQYGKSNYIIKKPNKEVSFTNGLPYCHQSSFIKKEIFDLLKFAEEFKIYADFDQFARAKKNKVSFEYVDLIVAKFNCDGISSAKSFKQLNELYSITKKYNILAAVYLILNILIKELGKAILPDSYINKIRLYINNLK